MSDDLVEIIAQRLYANGPVPSGPSWQPLPWEETLDFIRAGHRSLARFLCELIATDLALGAALAERLGLVTIEQIAADPDLRRTALVSLANASVPLPPGDPTYPWVKMRRPVSECIMFVAFVPASPPAQPEEQAGG